MAEKWRKRWFEYRKTVDVEYDNAKREFEMALKKPFITLRVGLPDGFNDLRSNFLSLEEDSLFHEEFKNLVKKRLVIEKRRREIRLKH